MYYMIRRFLQYLIALSFFPLVILNSCWTLNTSKKLQDAKQNAPYDAIIVPGVPYEGEEWSDVMKIRVYWSKYLFDRQICKNIIYSGSAVYTPYHEAQVMRAYAIELGIPEEHIFMDTLAEHSTENLYYSYCLAQTLGFQNVALATDPFQNKMLKGFNRKMRKNLGAHITFIPLVIDSLKRDTLYTPPLKLDTLEVSPFVSIKEREGFWERFKGTRGKKIDWNCK